MGVGGQCVEISNLSLEHRCTCTHYFLKIFLQETSIFCYFMWNLSYVCFDVWSIVLRCFLKVWIFITQVRPTNTKFLRNELFILYKIICVVILYIFLIILYTWLSIIIYISFHSTHDLSCFWMTQMVLIHGFLFCSLTAITKVFFHFFCVCYDMPWW